MKHYFWVLLEKLGVLAIKIASLMLLARLLSPGDFGIYAIAAIIVSMAGLLMDSGMAGALIKKQNATDSDYSTVFIYNFMVALVVYGLIYATAPMIARFYGEFRLQSLLRMVGLVVIIRSMGLIQVARLTKELLFKHQSIMYVGCSVVSLLAAYLLATRGYGYWALAGQALVESALIVIAFWLRSRYFPRLRFSWSVFKEHFSFASRLMLSSFVDLLSRNATLAVIGKISGFVTAGLYSQASKIQEIFIQLITEVIDKASFPLLVRRVNAPGKYMEYASQLLRMACLIGFYCVAVLSGGAEYLVGVVLGGQWSGSVWILKIISLAGYAMIIEAVTRSYLKSQGRSGVILKLSLIKSVMLLAVCLLFFVAGLRAVLYGLVALSVVFALFNIYAVSTIIDYPIRRQCRDVVVFAVPAVVAMLVVNHTLASFNVAPVVGCVAVTLGVAALYCIILRVIGVRELSVIGDYLRKTLKV